MSGQAERVIQVPISTGPRKALGQSLWDHLLQLKPSSCRVHEEKRWMATVSTWEGGEIKI